MNTVVFPSDITYSKLFTIPTKNEKILETNEKEILDTIFPKQKLSRINLKRKLDERRYEITAIQKSEPPHLKQPSKKTLIKKATNLLISHLNNELFLIIQYGSTLTNSFVINRSDVDLAIFLNVINKSQLHKIKLIKTKFFKETGVDLDLRIFSKKEYNRWISNKIKHEFLNEFAKYRLKKGVWKIIYSKKNLTHPVFKTSLSSAKKFCFLNLSSRMKDLRETILFHKYNNSKSDQRIIRKKTISTCFDIAYFCEFIAGTMPKSKWVVTKKHKFINKTELSLLKRLMKIRHNKKQFTKKDLIRTTNISENMFKRLNKKIVTYKVLFL